MCGIIGYVGDRQAHCVILDGLKRLEYRGYDSAGIAVIEDDRLYVCKEKGKISQLTAALGGCSLRGGTGIGHTRWATHGEPNKINAHPHIDCSGRIAVVHNGIIENYASLKEKLISRGHKFSSLTDSEVIAHLIEEYIKEGCDFYTAVRRCLKELEGTYALGVVHRDSPQELICSRNGSPLIIGLGDKENFVASDIPALLKYTKKIIVLDDYQMARLTTQGINITDLEGRVCDGKMCMIGWTTEDAEKGEFAHFMLKEIYEQPQVIRRLLEYYVDKKSGEIKFDEIFLSSLKFTPEKVKRINRIIAQACGTSFNAALLGKYLLGLFSRISSSVEISSEFRYQTLIASQETPLLSLTQSGETTDTLLALRKAKSHKLKTLSLCNVPASSIARESDAVIYTYAGPEIGVASTKSYTAQLLILYLLAFYLGEKKGLITSRKKEELVSQLYTIPQVMERIFSYCRPVIEGCADKFHQTRDFLYLGRSLHYPSALEGALKLKEIAYVHASAHPAGEMKHGPIALIDKDVCVVAIAPQGSLYEKIVSNIEEVKARKGRIIAIATEGNNEIKKYCEEVIYLPLVEEYLYPLVAALPLQLFAYFTALKRGCDIDQPRNLAKSVTVE